MGVPRGTPVRCPTCKREYQYPELLSLHKSRCKDEHLPFFADDVEYVCHVTRLDQDLEEKLVQLAMFRSLVEAESTSDKRVAEHVVVDHFTTSVVCETNVMETAKKEFIGLSSKQHESL